MFMVTKQNPVWTEHSGVKSQSTPFTSTLSFEIETNTQCYTNRAI